MATTNVKEDPTATTAQPPTATGAVPKQTIKQEESRTYHQPEEVDLNPVEAQQNHTARLQPPRFSGEGTDTAAAVSAFLTQLADYFRSANTDEAKKPALLSFCFKPEDSVAARWWATQRDKGVPTETWNQCEALIKTRFLTQKSPTEIVALVDSLNQRPTENVKAFADRVDQALIIIAQQRGTEGMEGLTAAQNKIAAAAFHEEQAKTYFLRGLPHHIRAKVQAFEMGTYEKCVQAAARVKLANRDELKRQPTAYAIEEPRPIGMSTEREEMELLKSQIAALQVRSAPRRDNRRGPPTEGGAQRPRWLTSDKVPRDVCYRCGHTGHQARACRTNPNNYNWGKLIKERNLRNNGTPSSQWRPRGPSQRDF